MNKKGPGIVIGFFVKAVVGMALIFFINEFLESQGIPSGVGMNYATLGVTGIFGIPGVALLYGIGFY